MRVLDLFSGIGGFSLGLERAGMKTVAFCEIEPFCRRVLAKHWPEVPCYDDVRTLTADRLRADGIAVDVICGGFPCQDISLAGPGAGLSGSRSGLFWELVRAIRVVRPRYVVLENVAELLDRGMGEVLGALAESGYDAEYDCIPACAIGANHIRDRVWIIAHTRSIGLAFGERLLTRGKISDAAASASGGWNDLSVVGRAVHGIPNRVDRVRALGNAVVPQIPELIGRAILAAERALVQRQPLADAATPPRPAAPLPTDAPRSRSGRSAAPVPGVTSPRDPVSRSSLPASSAGVLDTAQGSGGSASALQDNGTRLPSFGQQGFSGEVIGQVAGDVVTASAPGAAGAELERHALGLARHHGGDVRFDAFQGGGVAGKHGGVSVDGGHTTHIAQPVSTQNAQEAG